MLAYWTGLSNSLKVYGEYPVAYNCAWIIVCVMLVDLLGNLYGVICL